MSKLELPEAPSNEIGSVKAWRSSVVIPTYRPLPAEHHPMFLEKRVYQGSSGKVYPLPFVGRIAEEKSDVAWDAVHIENEYLRVMILPELGGRIHVARDKTNGYDIIYRQDVIKPALVGLAGPWVSGGIEFNWPQHHRPSTYMPTDVEIEREPDGSLTIWCGEHEPMNRMMGTHGVRLRPGRSSLELRVRLYNRTELTQTFLWWANVATEVNEHYQSFFPPDATHVADHAKRATSTFPRCNGHYYGVDYAGRACNGVSDDQRPTQFNPPPGMYPPDDLSWYANIPVPTSYMCMGTSADFFGGYDHGVRAGIVHVANHHISPGKKQWTWGNHAFGYAWDRNLTDPDDRGVYRPYIEIMAGVFTDNQPDFSFLAPGETRTFSQFWYPIREIGPAVEANEDVALSFAFNKGVARIGIVATTAFPQARVEISDSGGAVVHTSTLDLSPDSPTTFEIPLACKERENVSVAVIASNGRELLAYRPRSKPDGEQELQSATEPAAPADVKTIEELYLIGLHLDQYRHATRTPEHYWREALRRDPADSRCNTAMGDWHLRRGEFTDAANHLRRAIATLTQRNPNPRDGEPLYLLGVVLRHLGEFDSAYDAFYKATWNAAWQSPAYFALAQIDCRRKHWAKALDHLDRALRVNAEHIQARDLKAIVQRWLGREKESAALLEATIALNPVAYLARELSGCKPRLDAQIRLDLAWELSGAGLLEDAIRLLADTPQESTSGAAPMVAYALAALHQQQGDQSAAAAARKAAKAAPWQYCFPSRLQEIALLRAAIEADASDARAPFYLGNLLYDRQRHDEAIDCWELAAKRDPKIAPVWRNLGIGYFNIRHNTEGALDAYQNAVTADPGDGRLLYERDQLWKRIGIEPKRRLAALEQRPEVTRTRDDLSIELASLYNLTNRPKDAASVLSSRRFQPWEGGEGLALGQHTRTHLNLARAALAGGDAKEAARLLEAALNAPENLGEARHLLANQSDVHFYLGVAYSRAGDEASSRRHHSIAAEARGDFQVMAVQSYSEMTYYSAMSLAALGREVEAKSLLIELRDYAEALAKKPAKIDFFATSLPDLLLFADDLDARQIEKANFMAAQAQVGLENFEKGRQLLQKILAENPNHADAADLLAMIAEEGVIRRGS